MQENRDRPSIIAAYTIGIANTLEQCGVDPVDVFEECGLQLPTVTDPLRRLGNREVSDLFACAVNRTGNPAFGLLVGESIHPGNLHALGYALLSSTTLRDFCERLASYYRIVSQNAAIRVEENGKELILVTETTAPDICWETQDAFAALIIRFVRFIYSTDFNPSPIIAASLPLSVSPVSNNLLVHCGPQWYNHI